MNRLLVVLGLLSLVVCLGCSDDDDNPEDNNNPPPVYDGTITATVAGDLDLTFACTTAYGLAAAGDPGEGIVGIMQVQGEVTHGGHEYMISIQIFEDPATGTYTFVFPPESGTAAVAQDNVGNFADSGSVTFTTVSATRLVGTFTYHAFRVISPGVLSSIDVTDGSFDVPVIDIEP